MAKEHSPWQVWRQANTQYEFRLRALVRSRTQISRSRRVHPSNWMWFCKSLSISRRLRFLPTRRASIPIRKIMWARSSFEALTWNHCPTIRTISRPPCRHLPARRLDLMAVRSISMVLVVAGFRLCLRSVRLGLTPTPGRQNTIGRDSGELRY